MIAQISISVSWQQLSILGAVLLALHVVTGMILNAIITNHVRGEIDRELEDYRTETRRIEHAAKVAELLAAAVNPAGIEEPQRFNQLTWELSLWMPKELVRDLSDRLTGTADRDPRQLLCKIRKHLHGKDDDLDWKAIAYLPGAAYKESRARIFMGPRKG